MLRKQLMRRLRVVQRLIRRRDEAQKNLDAYAAKFFISPGELRVLRDHADGYRMVCDARDENKHVTLSDVEEQRVKEARERAEKRAAHKERLAAERKRELKAEKVNRKVAEAKQLAEMLKAAGFDASALLK